MEAEKSLLQLEKGKYQLSFAGTAIYHNFYDSTDMTALLILFLHE